MSFESTRKRLSSNSLITSDGTRNVWLPEMDVIAALKVIEAAQKVIMPFTGKAHMTELLVALADFEALP